MLAEAVGVIGEVGVLAVGQAFLGDGVSVQIL